MFICERYEQRKTLWIIVLLTVFLFPIFDQGVQHLYFALDPGNYLASPYDLGQVGIPHAWTKTDSFLASMLSLTELQKVLVASNGEDAKS